MGLFMINAMDRKWKQAVMPQPEIISRNVSVRNDSKHTRIAVRISGLCANIWNGTAQVRGPPKYEEGAKTTGTEQLVRREQ